MGDEAFSLPSEFLTFDDLLKDHIFNTPDSCFPSDFPLDFHHHTSPSTRLTEPTRSPLPFPSYNNYVQKSRSALAGSPPSTVPHFGRRPVSSGGENLNFLSQPMGSAGNVWAANELAEIHKLKLNRKLHQHLSQPPPRNTTAAFNNALVQRVREEQLLKLQQQRNVWSNHHAQNSDIWNFEKQNRVGRSAIGAYGENEQLAWRSLHCISHQNQENITISPDGFVNAGSGNQVSGGVKKQRSGTGVFIPRSYNDNKKSGCLTAPVVDRGGPGHYSNFKNMGSGLVQPSGQTRMFDGFDSDYDLELAKMKLLLLQRRQLILAGSIPQDGTY